MFQRIDLLLMALLSMGSMGGCVMLPLPPVGAQRGMEEIGSLEVGSATREEVQEALGDPDLTVGGRYEIFDLSEEDLNLLVIPVLLPVAGFGPVGEARHRVLAEYGPGDVLLSLHWEALVEERSVAGQAPPLSPDESGDPGRPGTLRRASNWQVPENWGNAVAVAPSGQNLAISYGVGEAEGRARSLTQVRDGRTGQLLQEIEYGPVGCPLLLPPERGIPGLAEPTAFLSNETHLVSLAREGAVCVWNFERQRGVHTLDAGEGDARRLASARYAPILASADAEGLVKVWDGISGNEITSVSPCALEPGCDRDGWSLSLALSDDGRLLATSQYGGRGYLGTDYQGAVTVWNASNGEPLARIALPKDGLMLADQKLAFSEDRSRLAVHLGDHVQVWRLSDVVPGERPEETIQRSDLPVELERVLLLPLEDQEPYRERSLGFSGAGTRLVAGRGSVVAWETGTWRQVWRWVPPSPYSEIGWELGQGFAVPANDEVLVTADGVWKPKTDSKEREHADGEG